MNDCKFKVGDIYEHYGNDEFIGIAIIIAILTDSTKRKYMVNKMLQRINYNYCYKPYFYKNSINYNNSKVLYNSELAKILYL